MSGLLAGIGQTKMDKTLWIHIFWFVQKLTGSMHSTAQVPQYRIKMDQSKVLNTEEA